MVDLTQVEYLSAAGTDPAAWPAVPRLENGWHPTGGEIDPEADGGLMNWQARELGQRTDTLKARVDDLGLKAGAVYGVGAGGDFDTINEALGVLSERRPAYAPGGFMTELRLLSGFVMAEQVLVAGINLGWITITGEDAEHFIDRAYLTQQFGIRIPAFGVTDGGFLPTLNCLFTMMQTGAAADRCGVMAGNTGGARVGSGAGVRNAGADGANCYAAGYISMSNSIFIGAGGNGLNCGGSTRASALGADLSDAGIAGVRADYGAAVQVSSADLSGAGTSGVDCRYGANVNCDSANCRVGGSDSSSDIQVLYGGTVAARNATGGTSQAANTITGNGIIFK